MRAPPPPPVAAPTGIAIVNARVRTGDPRRPWADAVFVRGERIDTVGSSAEVKKRVGTTVRVVDARGMLVTPATEAGVLRTGMPADLVIVSAAIPPHSTRVLLTMTGGRIVHDTLQEATS